MTIGLSDEVSMKLSATVKEAVADAEVEISEEEAAQARPGGSGEAVQPTSSAGEISNEQSLANSIPTGQTTISR
jgi:hypothetical protein